MRERIVDFLRKKPGYVSGEEISEDLGISRQALWKHIHELKDSGFDIVAVPHLGYKLISSPDRLFPSEITSRLNTRFMGRKIYYFDSLPSTIDIATSLGLRGAAEGTAVIAESQSKGRGRLGRVWFSPKYKGIYLSLILRPDILPAQAPIFTLLAGVSVSEAVKLACAIETQIKWPNDIMVNNKKLGGILTELNAEMDKVHFLILSIGINVNNDKKSMPATAVSLKELKKEPVNRIELLQGILNRVEANYLGWQKKGNAQIIEKWREHNITLGRRVKVLFNRRQVEGEAKDIDADGSLIVRTDSGLSQKITAGDVVHCR